MFELSLPEKTIFITIAVLYMIASSIVLHELISKGSKKYNQFLLPILSLAITLEAVFMIFRAISIKRLPLTGLFESLIVLTIAFGLLYLFLNIFIQQVWFSSIMVWIISVLFIIAGVFAKPASEPLEIAATPWAMVHGVSMIFGSVSIILAAASSFLYLHGCKKLKSKEIIKVMGKVPNIEKLENMTLFGIKAGFVFITIGIIGGLGLVATSGNSFLSWLLDLKVISIIIAWILLGSVLIMNYLLTLRGNIKAFLSLAIFTFVVFAVVGVTLLGATQHNFSGN